MGWEDDRAVSEVLGAILLFGILVLAIGGYQSFVVPQQNAEIEHEHDQQVNDEFPTIQEAISNAAASGKQRTASLTLGTDYPVRSLAVGWPSVSGNLKTGASGSMAFKDDEGQNIEVGEEDEEFLTDTCGLDPETRSIRYRANYNELRNTGTYIYEHGVTYRHFEKSDGQVLRRGEQELIDGDTIRLYPIQNGEFDRTTSSSERLRFQPGRTGSRMLGVPGDGEVVLELPTELPEDQWRKLLSDEDAIVTDEINVSGGILELPLAQGKFRVNCTPVGLQQAPEQSSTPTMKQDNQINPAGPGSVQYLSTTTRGDHEVTVTFTNRDIVPRTITHARVAFYSANAISRGADGTPGWVDYDGDSTPDREIGGQADSIEEVVIDPDRDGDVALGFYCDEAGDVFSVSEDDFFVLSLQFENGDMANYFIKPEGPEKEQGIKRCSN